MKKCCKHVGLLNSDFGVYTKRTQAKRMKIRNIDSSFIEEEISKRAKARLEKNFLLADFIRGELLQVGVKLQDEETQTTWQVVI